MQPSVALAARVTALFQAQLTEVLGGGERNICDCNGGCECCGGPGSTIGYSHGSHTMMHPPPKAIEPSPAFDARVKTLDGVGTTRVVAAERDCRHCGKEPNDDENRFSENS